MAHNEPRTLLVYIYDDKQRYAMFTRRVRVRKQTLVMYEQMLSRRF